MPVFNRIFNFDQDAVARMEQRLNTRYVPGAAFPLQAWLLAGPSEWPAKIMDVSGNGISLLLEAGAKVAPEDLLRVRLRFGAHQQLISAQVIHARTEADGQHYGLGLRFPDFVARKTYLQLLQPVVIGQSLQQVPDERVAQDAPPFHKRVYRSDDGSGLTVWVEQTPGAPLHHFEFRMKDYFCKGDGQTGTLTTNDGPPGAAKGIKSSNPIFAISGSLDAEVRQLFRWILPNLATGVPDDVRTFLQRFAT